MKHGKGKIVHGNTTGGSHGNEVYEGEWDHDLMHGEGTYTFTSGAVYQGQWANGKRHGTGRIDYLDGSSYEGQWEDDQMHGDGRYVDSDGIVWDGIFVNNTYESKIQKKLQSERKIQLKIKEYERNATDYFKKFFEAFSASDKKTMKENLSPFFVKPEELQNYVKEPYPKYEEKPADQWNDVFHKLIDEGDHYCNALTKPSDATIIDEERILVDQLGESPGGQVVEFSHKVDTKTI